MKRKHIPQVSFGGDPHSKAQFEDFSGINKTNLSSVNQNIRNCKHAPTKTSPMRLKIIRSREGSPVLNLNKVNSCAQSSNFQTKVMGSVSMHKIKLINGGKKSSEKPKPITTQISLCDNKPPTAKKYSGGPTKHKKPQGLINKNRNQPTYYRAAKLVELSFEEEIDYDENTIIDQHKMQQFKKAAKDHRRK